ncbi:hypothetical protein G5V59_18345 [Nocardioides sp. W3-2-3]|uniref:hypothetical protein n=1 Tax=Nocardioides convexus TaxID=2712224 RepID=UPI0024182511|nr:hypothetical protein [Nocardioides convexus]NHA01156.1 hypothetical protein [Nocardioides convexus]
MRSITRPLAAVATSALLALSLAACGDGGDDKASDGNSPSESTRLVADGGRQRLRRRLVRGQ